MAEKTVKSRVQIKRGTSAEWALATNFYPLDGEIIFYSDLNKIKIGNGTTLVEDLPFVSGDHLIATNSQSEVLIEGTTTVRGKNFDQTYDDEGEVTSSIPLDDFTIINFKNGTIDVTEKLNLANCGRVEVPTIQLANPALSDYNFEDGAEPTSGSLAVVNEQALYNYNSFVNDKIKKAESIINRAVDTADVAVGIANDAKSGLLAHQARAEDFYGAYHQANIRRVLEEEDIVDPVEGQIACFYTLDSNIYKQYTNGKWEELVIKQIPITWAELKDLRDSGKLVPEQQYRITDYETTTVQEDTDSAGHQFDIIVTADSKNTLNENARATYHYNEDGEVDPYFVIGEVTQILTSASYKPNITLDDVKILYGISDEQEGNYGLDDNSTLITELTTHINENGIEVPALLNPDPNEGEHDCLYVYRGKEQFGYKNELVSIYYVISQDDETLYEGNAPRNNSDVFVEIGMIDGRLPVMYKTDPTNVDAGGLTDVDYADEFKYLDNFELDGVVYNRWEKYEGGVYSGYDFLTNVIVVNNEFIITQEDFAAAVVPNICDKWQEYYADSDEYAPYYKLTNEIIDATFEDVLSDPSKYKNNLPAWEIKYCLDNNISRYIWADIENGKGVIYYMKDEFNNEAPYDFKNIRFYRADHGMCYTFGGKVDRSIKQDDPFVTHTFNNNSIGTYYTGCDEAFGLPNNVFLGTSGCMTKDNKLGTNCTMNTFGNAFQYNILGNDCSDNTFGNECFSNTFGDGCHENIIGNNCSSNTFGNTCCRNTLIENCNNSIFGNACTANSFNADCSNNIFGNKCNYNYFGTGSYGNVFGNNCYENTFGEDCYCNTFRNDCYKNVFHKGCHRNSFSNWCWSNTFEDSCYFNTFEIGCNNNNFGDSCIYNTLWTMCSYNTFGNSSNSNTLGIYCSSNKLEHSCRYNTYNSYCYRNNLGPSCWNNIFESNCSYNTIGSNSSYNKFGSDCNYNLFGDATSTIDHCRYITLDAGVCNTYINTIDTSTSESTGNSTSRIRSLQNINIHKGIAGASSTNRLTITVPSRDLNYSTDYYKSESKEVLL